MDKSLLLLAAIILIGSVLGWTGVLIWRALEQRRSTEIGADSHEEVKFVRLAGCRVSDESIRLLINELVAQGSREAHETAQRISSARVTGLHLASAGLTGLETDLPLTPAQRNIVLNAIPDPTPEGLVHLRDSLVAAAIASRPATAI
jgi:hypothetical protein